MTWGNHLYDLKYFYFNAGQIKSIKENMLRIGSGYDAGFALIIIFETSERKKRVVLG